MILVYPNPARNYIKVTKGNVDMEEILIFNTWGQKVFQTSLIDDFLDIRIDFLEKGVYFLKVRSATEEVSLTQKLIVE